MKYIQKFNESIFSSNYITQSDFDKIENLFLFWSDEKPIEYRQRYQKGWMLKSFENSKIEENCVEVLIKFPASIFNNIDDSLKLNQDDFLKKFKFELIKDKHAVFLIQNLNDIEKSDGPYPKANPKSQCQKVLRVLNSEYGIKQDLIDIFTRTKGLDHYGFKWRLSLDCSLRCFRIGGGVLGADKRYSHDTIDVSIHLTITK